MTNPPNNTSQLRPNPLRPPQTPPPTSTRRRRRSCRIPPGGPAAAKPGQAKLLPPGILANRGDASSLRFEKKRTRGWSKRVENNSGREDKPRELRRRNLTLFHLQPHRQVYIFCCYPFGFSNFLIIYLIYFFWVCFYQKVKKRVAVISIVLGRWLVIWSCGKMRQSQRFGLGLGRFVSCLLALLKDWTSGQWSNFYLFFDKL